MARISADGGKARKVIALPYDKVILTVGGRVVKSSIRR